MSEIISVGQAFGLRRGFDREVGIITDIGGRNTGMLLLLRISETCFGGIGALIRIEVDFQSTRSQVISGIGGSRMNIGILCSGDARQTWKSFLKRKTFRAVRETRLGKLNLSGADRVQNNGCMANRERKPMSCTVR